jgi:hypothetical protein
MRFIKDIFFKYWDKFDLIISGLGFVSFAFDNLTTKYKILFVAIGLTLAFIIKLIRQSYDYFQNYLRPLKVKGSVKGEAAYTGLTLIKIEPTDYLRQFNLLTLYCKGTDIFQPICILEIIRCELNEDIIAVQIIPSADDLKISKYLNEESRMNSLYVRPIISNNEIEQIKTKLTA